MSIYNYFSRDCCCAPEFGMFQFQYYHHRSPNPELALACGSASISNTFFSKTPKEAARFTDVVVFPTPPFD
jgi:hypothetical protein